MQAVLQSKVPSMGRTRNEMQHRRLAGEFLHGLTTWGYFVPHIHKCRDDQEVRYDNQTTKFKAKLFMNVNYCVALPMVTKETFLMLIDQRHWWQHDQIPDC